MPQDQGPSNPLKGLLDRAKQLFGSDADSDSKRKRRSPDLLNEAEQRAADDAFEERKAKEQTVEIRRAAAVIHRRELEQRAEKNLRAARAQEAKTAG